MCCKLDRMLGNDEWMASSAHFHPEGMLDHSPAVLCSHLHSVAQKRPTF